eukprot:TRINITY_DN24162_c0_g1_i1.p1 TRINITY_DN24162_c0_g1~~TRINITY_DN24162_c0_g1_i1.p1  ORF type:complete len:364 (-),score=31.12 TRINITY_DN24162_c0_g1_i1:93-1184(-)
MEVNDAGSQAMLRENDADRGAALPERQNTPRFSQIYSFVYNGQKLFSGFALDVVRSVLVIKNWTQSWEALHDMMGDMMVFVSVFYALTILAPIIKMMKMKPVLISFRRQGASIPQALTFASDISHVLAYESAARTQLVHGGQSRCCWVSKLLDEKFLWTFYRAEVYTPEEKEMLDALEFPADLMTWKYSLSTLHFFSSCSSRVWIYCSLVLSVFSPLPCWKYSLMVPDYFLLLIKLKIWAACFDIAFYWYNLRLGTFTWDDFSSAWSWHLKVVLAVRSLWYFQKLTYIVNKWDWRRLGVMKAAPWPLDRSWEEWVSASLADFRWDDRVNMWTSLEDRLHAQPPACLADPEVQPQVANDLPAQQ